MANITKQKRDQMIAFLDELKKIHSDDTSVKAFNEIKNYLTEKKFGIVWEEHLEEVDELLKDNIPVSILPDIQNHNLFIRIITLCALPFFTEYPNQSGKSFFRINEVG